jgi:hypothetical protein
VLNLKLGFVAGVAVLPRQFAEFFATSRWRFGLLGDLLEVVGFWLGLVLLAVLLELVDHFWDVMQVGQRFPSLLLKSLPLNEVFCVSSPAGAFAEDLLHFVQNLNLIILALH